MWVLGSFQTCSHFPFHPIAKTTLFIVVLRIGSQSRNGTCRRHTCCDSRMQRVIWMALHPTSPRIYPSTSHPPTTSERVFSNQNSAPTSYDCKRGELTTHYMKCVNTFAFAPTSTSKKTNMRGVSGITPAPIWQLTNVKPKLTEPPKSIVYVVMRCCCFQTPW